MNFSDPFLILAVVFLLAAVACALWAVAAQKRAARAEAQAWLLNEKVTQAEERMRLLEDQSATQIELIKAQAAQSANTIAEQLIKRADENAKSRERLAEARIEAQLKPVAETLAKFEAQVTAVEKARAEETGGLKAQIAQLLEASTATQVEARKLSAALRRGAGVQGRWGEQTLRNVLEAAGLNSRFDFQEQFSVDSEEGRRRPDVTVTLPGGGVFVIDAKCSLNAFLEAQDATDEARRQNRRVEISIMQGKPKQSEEIGVQPAKP